MSWELSTSKVEHVKTLFTFEQSVLARLRIIVAAKAQQVAATARAKVKGRIAESIIVKDVDNKYGIKGIIASKWYVGRFFELGYGGKPVKVRAFTRHYKPGDVIGIIKKKTFKKKSNITWGVKTAGTTKVKGYTRPLPRIHRPFLTAALDELRGSIRSAVASAISEVARGS
jgi:hypothetical protein